MKITKQQVVSGLHITSAILKIAGFAISVAGKGIPGAAAYVPLGGAATNLLEGLVEEAETKINALPDPAPETVTPPPAAAEAPNPTPVNPA